jgi:hypothetical protein
MTGDGVVMMVAIFARMRRSLLVVALLWQAESVLVAQDQACRATAVPGPSFASGDLLGYVEAPDVVRYGADLWLVGSPALLWSPARSRTDSHAIDDVFLGFRLRGSAVTPIRPPFEMLTAEASRARVASNQLHVVWRKATEDTLTAIQHAVWNGREWTRPVTVARGRWRWAKDLASALIARNDTLFVAVASDSAGGRVGVLRWANGVWTHRAVQGPLNPGYVTLQATASELVLVFSAASPPADPNWSRHGDLYQSSSLDGGQTWSEPRVIVRSGVTAPHYPRLTLTSTGRLALTWAIASDGGISPDSLALSFRDDRDWRRAPGIHVPAHFLLTDVVPDAAGGVTAVLLDRGMNAIRLARHRSESWCIIDVPGTESALPGAVAQLEPDGRYLVLWGTRTPFRTIAGPQMLAVIVTICC